MRLKLATYNIHGAIGSDARFDPSRILGVLRELDADVIALQEVQSEYESGRELLAYLAAETGLHALAGPTLWRESGHYGNALLSRWPMQDVLRLDLSYRDREPRGALSAVVACRPGVRLQIVTTHLGLRPIERRYQVRRLLELFEVNRDLPAVLLGDLNEWWLWGQPVRWLHAYFRETPALASFPARFPLFSLDRIWVRPRASLERIARHDSALARRASDHRPILALIECPGNSSA